MKRMFIICVIFFAGGLSFSAFLTHSGKQKLLSFLDDQGRMKHVRSVADWETKRQQILLGMQEAMGKLPAKPDKGGLNMVITDSVLRNDHTRLTIHFPVAENERVNAYLYLPSGSTSGKKFPAMLALHGTGPAGKKYVDGETPKQNRAYARELAQRGYVVVAPDYPGMGDAKDYDFARDRYASGTMKGIFNHIRCVDLLQSLDCVDTARIGVIGHSLGGHNAIFAGAFDKRLKVIVSSCGWTLMDYYDIGETAITRYGGRLGPWAQERYMPLLRTKFGLDPEKIPFDFDGAIAVLSPRAFFSNSPVNDSNFDVAGVRKGMTEIMQVYRFLHAKDRLRVIYPVAAHDFPPEAREEAYRFIDQILNRNPASRNQVQ